MLFIFVFHLFFKEILWLIFNFKGKKPFARNNTWEIVMNHFNVETATKASHTVPIADQCRP